MNSGQLLTQVMAFVALYLTLVWIAAQAYLLPLVIRHDVPTLDAFRGAVLMALGQVGRSAAFVVVAVAAIGVSVAFILPLVLVVPVTLALVGHRMAHDRFRDARTLGPGYRIRHAMTRPCLATREARRGARTEAAGGER